MKFAIPAVSIIAVLLVCAGAWLYTPDRPRAALEAKYLANPADYRLVAGIRLHLRDTGPSGAPAIILLHGFGSSLQTGDPWADTLSATYRVIRYDLPGFGLTGPDPTGDYSDARAMAILLAVMDQLGLKRATLIGNSMGGKLAWQFAATHPDRVDKLVLISPDGFASPGFEYGRKPDVPWMLKLLPYTLPRGMFRASLLPAYGDPSNLTDATLTRYYDNMLAPGDRAAMITRMSQVLLQDPRPLLARIQAPTLLLWGEKDGMIPFTNSADYLRDIPHATLVALPGLGHVPFEEAPAVSLPPVLHFLAAPPPPG
jgi:pimeloyl-ACP methyl ester carboxylesterase